jgi:hypothetical protein
MENECPCMRGMGSLQNPMGSSSGPTRGVAKVSVTPPFHTPELYDTFPGAPTPQTMEYCEIFQTRGHAPKEFPIIKKYTTASNTIVIFVHLRPMPQINVEH